MNNDHATSQHAELAHLFRHASRLMARFSHRRDHAHHAQGRVLSIIRERGDITQAELLELLDVRSSSLSEVLGKLERTNLIARRRNEADKRGFIISATAEGEALLGGHEGTFGESADRFFACIDDTEKEQLRSILLKIVEALKDDPLAEGAEGYLDREHSGCGHHGHARRGRGFAKASGRRGRAAGSEGHLGEERGDHGPAGLGKGRRGRRAE